MKLKEFNLEEAKAGKQVYTRDGHKARIICYDRRGSKPIVALIDDKDDSELYYSFTNEGKFYYDCDSEHDLMMKEDELPSIWVARDSDGELFAYNMKPEREIDVNGYNRGDWHCTEEGEYMNVSKELFPEVKNEDDEPRELILKPNDMGEMSDGYHTFNELYRYRMLYNAGFFHFLKTAGYDVVKSKKHNDGGLCFGGGWFIVMANLPNGQVSNHYEMKDWSLFKIPEVDRAPAWDGHTPEEAADRIEEFLKLHCHA